MIDDSGTYKMPHKSLQIPLIVDQLFKFARGNERASFDLREVMSVKACLSGIKKAGLGPRKYILLICSEGDW